MRFKRTAAAIGAGVFTVGLGTAALAAGSLSKSVIDPTASAAARTITVSFSGKPANTTIFVNQCRVDGNAPGVTFNPNIDCSPQGATFVPSGSGSGTATFVAWGGLEPNLEEFGCGYTTPAGTPQVDTCYIRITPDSKANLNGQEFFPITFAPEPPVVPEVPLNILLPLSAAAVLGGGAVIVTRKRRSQIAA
jgi:hypothetical protein